MNLLNESKTLCASLLAVITPRGQLRVASRRPTDIASHIIIFTIILRFNHVLPRRSFRNIFNNLVYVRTGDQCIIFISTEALVHIIRDDMRLQAVDLILGTRSRWLVKERLGGHTILLLEAVHVFLVWTFGSVRKVQMHCLGHECFCALHAGVVEEARRWRWVARDGSRLQRPRLRALARKVDHFAILGRHGP